MIYIYKHMIGGKPYIGQTENPKKRFNISSYRNTERVYNAMKEYNYDFTKTEILKIVNTNEEANKLEIELIEKYDSINNGWNVYKGGNHSVQKKVGAFTEEHIKNLSNAMKGNKNQKPRAFTEESKNKLSESRKRIFKYLNNKKHSVVYLITKEVFKSVSECSEATGISTSTITRHCNGERLNQLFMYKEDYDKIISNQASEAH